MYKKFTSHVHPIPAVDLRGFTKVYSGAVADRDPWTSKAVFNENKYQTQWSYQHGSRY